MLPGKKETETCSSRWSFRAAAARNMPGRNSISHILVYVHVLIGLTLTRSIHEYYTQYATFYVHPIWVHESIDICVCVTYVYFSADTCWFFLIAWKNLSHARLACAHIATADCAFGSAARNAGRLYRSHQRIVAQLILWRRAVNSITPSSQRRPRPRSPLQTVCVCVCTHFCVLLILCSWTNWTLDNH